ncbi:nuclear transport factor 2 family protein [Dyella sp. SG609]|uniref:YybH family protein n=1 Tax=Dyella sp. SG609 TaxID=2587018 RepID=UPI0014485A23|nr:nuclear transport factor 2 family protein [Dyella sp. SG609]NKJ21478.1 ketosteroid isomerase-like protein [Dyella sp. SG609]
MPAPHPDAIDGLDTHFAPEHPLAALSGFYRAFNQRDLEAMARNWSHDEAASMSNPLGGIERGWSRIRAVYERIFLGEAHVRVVFHDYTLHEFGLHEFGDAFLAVGRERGVLERSNTKLELAIRTTRLYRRVDGQWRQFHHHGSFEDPALLEAYHEAVR